MCAASESFGSSTRRDTALRPGRAAIVGLTFGDDQDLAMFGSVRGKRETGNSRSDDQMVGLD